MRCLESGLELEEDILDVMEEEEWEVKEEEKEEKGGRQIGSGGGRCGSGGLLHQAVFVAALPIVLVKCLSLPAKIIEGVGPYAEDESILEAWSEVLGWRT